MVKRSSVAGELVHTVEHPGVRAFVPAPLPPRIDWTNALALRLADAVAAVGNLNGLGVNLKNPHILIRPYMRREAVLSSRIEGTMATVGELALLEAKPDAPTAALRAREPEVREVLNYVRALEHGLRSTLPVTVRLIRELHAQLMEGVRGQEQAPGEFRRRQNWIGKEGTPIQRARFVPPPPDRVPALLAQLERFVNTDESLPLLVRVALAHYQFETIHPFLDGNGRVGRLLITLLLCRRGALRRPLLYLSDYFERNRQAYYDHLLAVSTESRWNDWLDFFLAGVHEQASEAGSRADRLMELHGELIRRVTAKRSSVLLTKLVDYLFEQQAVTIRQVAEHLGVTFPTASENVDRLVEKGILEEVTGGGYGRIFVAPEILELTEPD